jgi:hypothetical protein
MQKAGTLDQPICKLLVAFPSCNCHPCLFNSLVLINRFEEAGKAIDYPDKLAPAPLMGPQSPQATLLLLTPLQPLPLHAQQGSTTTCPHPQNW